MTTQSEILGLEHEAWQALSTNSGAVRALCERVLDPEVVMLLPGGLVIEGSDQALESMSGPPWDSYELSHERVLTLSGDAAVVVYQARARRGDLDYLALINSTYVRRGGGWRLALHQQTPIELR